MSLLELVPYLLSCCLCPAHSTLLDMRERNSVCDYHPDVLTCIEPDCLNWERTGRASRRHHMHDGVWGSVELMSLSQTICFDGKPSELQDRQDRTDE